MHIRGQALNEQIYQYIIVVSGVGLSLLPFSVCARARGTLLLPTARSLFSLPLSLANPSRPAPSPPPAPPRVCLCRSLQSLGFLYGAYMEDFGYCVRAWFGGCCLACLVRRLSLFFLTRTLTLSYSL